MGNKEGKPARGDEDNDYGGDDWTEYSSNNGDPKYRSASDDESRASSVRREFARSNTPRFAGGSTQPPTLRTDNSFMNRSDSQSSLSDVYSLGGLQSASAVGVPVNRTGMFQVPEGAESATRLVAAGPRIPGQTATAPQVRKITVVHKQLPDGSYGPGVAMENRPENPTHREVAPPLNNPPPNMTMSPPPGIPPGYRQAQPPPGQTRHLPPAPPPPMSPQHSGALIYDDSQETPDLSLPPLSASFKPYTGSAENVPSLYEEPISYVDQHSDSTSSYRSTQQAIRDHMYDNNVGASEHDTMQRRPITAYSPQPPSSPPPPQPQPPRLGNAEVQVSIYEGSSQPGTRSHMEASQVACTALVPTEPKKKKKKCKPKLPSDYTVTREIVTEDAVVLRPRAGPGNRRNCVKSIKEEAVVLKKRQGPQKPKTKTKKDQVWVLERRRSPVREVIREVIRDRTPQSEAPSSSQDSERIVIQPVMVPVYYNQEPQPAPEPIIKTRTVIQPIIIKEGGGGYSQTGSSRSGRPKHAEKGHKKKSGGSHGQAPKGSVSSSRRRDEFIVQPIKGDMILKKPSDHSYENNPIVVPLYQDDQSEVSSSGGEPSGGAIVAEVEVSGGGGSARYYNLRHVKDSISAHSSRKSRDSNYLTPPTKAKQFGTVSSEVPSFISPERPGDSVRVLYHTHLQENGQDMAQDWELDAGNQRRPGSFNPGSTTRSMPVLPEIIVDEPEPGDSVSQKGDTLRSRSSKASSHRSHDVTRQAAALSRELTGDEAGDDEQENRRPGSASSVSSSVTSSVTRRQSDSSSSITGTTTRRTLATTTDSSTEQGTSARDRTTKTSESTTDRSSTTSSSSSTTRRRRTITSSSQSSSTNDRSSTTSSRSSSTGSATTATRTLTRRTADEDDDGDESDSTLKAEEENDVGRKPGRTGSFVRKMRDKIKGVFGGSLNFPVDVTM